MTTGTHHLNPLDRKAFTLIELLAVIAIIGIIAALVVAAVGRVTPTKVRSRAQAEIANLTSMIETYKSKKGFYPSDKTTFAAVEGQNLDLPVALYYELIGTNLNECPVYVVNSGEESQNFGKSLKESQYQYVDAPNGKRIRVLGIPYKSPDSSKFAFWRYDNSSANRHNQEGFDLSINVIVSGKTNTIGNWKE